MPEPAFVHPGPPGALKICVLTDEFFYPWTPAPYFQDYNWELYYLNSTNSVSAVRELCQRDFDIFSNFCDGTWNEPRPGTGSQGIEPASLVKTPEALRIQARKVMAKYGHALVEQYIEGREFTVLVVENSANPYAPKVYQPIEFVFPPGETFKHFYLKWVDFKQLKAKPCADPFLAQRLMEAGRKLFVGLNGVSFGWCDIRVDPAGEIYMLEINPNCAVLYAPDEPGSADFALLNDLEGPRGFIERIFKAALARHHRRLPDD